MAHTQNSCVFGMLLMPHLTTNLEFKHRGVMWAFKHVEQERREMAAQKAPVFVIATGTFRLM
jgi:hypothetical protein